MAAGSMEQGATLVFDGCAIHRTPPALFQNLETAELAALNAKGIKPRRTFYFGLKLKKGVMQLLCGFVP